MSKSTISTFEPPWIKSVFFGCRIELHSKCTGQFEYQNETFVCQCECHSGNMERACVGFEVEGLNIAPWNAEK